MSDDQYWEIRSLTTQLGDANRRADRLENHLNYAESELNGAKERIAHLESLVEELEEENAELTVEATSLRRDLETAESSLHRIADDEERFSQY